MQTGYNRRRAVVTNRGWDTNAIMGHVDPHSVTESACAGSHTQIFPTNLCEAHFLSTWAARLGAMLFLSSRRFWGCKDIHPKKTGSIIHKGLWKKSACVTPHRPIP